MKQTFSRGCYCCKKSNSAREPPQHLQEQQQQSRQYYATQMIHLLAISQSIICLSLRCHYLLSIICYIRYFSYLTSFDHSTIYSRDSINHFRIFLKLKYHSRVATFLDFFALFNSDCGSAKQAHELLAHCT